MVWKNLQFSSKGVSVRALYSGVTSEKTVIYLMGTTDKCWSFCPIQTGWKTGDSDRVQ